MAEDLVQDTVERALRFEAHYKQGTNLRAWVHQILFSVFMTRCRQSRRERNALEALVTDPLAWTYPDERINDMSSLPPALARALGDLPVGFRHALELVDLDELAYKEAAALLDVPVGTVMSRLHRGRRLLAESLRSSEEETSPAAPPSSRSTPLKSRPTSPAAPATSRPVLLKSLSISPAARPAPRSRRSQGAVAEAA
jgi:RNA polymerase sigma-70 factor (ECF subfamily)